MRRMGGGRGGREEKLIELGKNNYFLKFGMGDDGFSFSVK